MALDDLWLSASKRPATCGASLRRRPADLVGVSHSAIALIESGRTQEPRPELIEAIAVATRFPFSFFEDDDEMEFSCCFLFVPGATC